MDKYYPHMLDPKKKKKTLRNLCKFTQQLVNSGFKLNFFFKFWALSSTTYIVKKKSKLQPSNPPPPHYVYRVDAYEVISS